MALSIGKKALRVFIFTALSLLTFAALISVAASMTIYSLNKVPLEKITQCFTTEWHKVHVCPTSPSYVTLSQVPEHLKWAVVLSEDASFYQHAGFDWFEIQKSMDTNLEKRAFVRGGSTISQQLIKNAFLSGERSVLRKIKEAYLTWKLEKAFSKNQILEAYLNMVEMGEGIFGVGEASRHYFNRSVEDLSPTHSAFLASLLPSPKRYQAHLNLHEALHPRHLHRVRRAMNLLVHYRKIAEGYIQVLEERERFGFWSSLWIWPEDELLASAPIELTAYSSEAEGLTEDTPAAALGEKEGAEEEALPDEMQEAGPAPEAEFNSQTGAEPAPEAEMDLKTSGPMQEAETQTAPGTH